MDLDTLIEKKARDPEKLIDKKEMAKQLGISLSKVNVWYAEGKFEYFKIGKQVRFRQREVDRFLKSVRVPAK